MKNNEKEAREVYAILLRRQMNEDRILAERNSLFFLASSFLFLGFVTLSSEAQILRIAISLLGLFLCGLTCRLNQLSIRALDYFHSSLTKLEKECSTFSYMKEMKITHDPFFKDNWLLRKLTVSHIHLIWIPTAFSILWICSLIWVIY